MVTKTKLLRAFWNCGDNDIIEFAIMRARLNKKEKEVLTKQACSSVPTNALIEILAEHMTCIQVLHPKEYSAIISKIKRI